MLLASFAAPASLDMRTNAIPEMNQARQQLENLFHPSSASGGGEEQINTAYMSRAITSQQVSILNSYVSPDTHEALLDLSGYLESGWTLHKVEIDAQDLTATVEREVVGAASTPGIDYRIEEYTADYYYSQLANGFYNQPHNGSLLNYSVSYYTLSYSTSSRGTSYLVVCSDYSDSSSGLTTPDAMTAHGSAFEWTTVDGENLNLTENTVYYTLINGTDLHEDAILQVYPSVYWGIESGAGSFTTRRYSTEFSAWSGGLSYEALLNYTYIPWDASTNSAQVYSATSDVSLEGNSTAFSGNSWSSGTSSQNITAILLTTDQSIDLNYNITLWYSRDDSGTSNWRAETSGGLVTWNSSMSVAFPSVSGQIERFLNFTVPSDWTVSGLYNSTNPGVNHDQYTRIGDVVVCSNVDTESWVLSSTAPNYVTGIALYDSSDDSVVTHTVDVTTVLDVNATVESPTLNPATTGSVNLTVVHSGVTAYAPANTSVASGLGYHSWNTGTDHDENGIHTVAVYWSNGTEAGYRTHDLVIIYPTEITSVSTIDAFTDSTFPFSVFFRDSYTPQPLDGALAAVTYSFDGGSNTTMTDHANGTWSDTVDTTSKSPGTYDLIVYGEGFAFENVSRVIKVTLIHDTQALDVSWSNGPDITYVENSELIVVYRRTSGDNVTNAQVNATIGLNTWLLNQQPDESYRIRFNGTDNPPGFGVHSISISAWRAGYEPESNDLESLTIDKEDTSLQVSWSNTNNITFLDSTILSVKYLMSNSTEIPGAELNVTIGSTTWDLLWSSGTSAYEIQFNGTDATTGLATHSLLIQASLYGYFDASDSDQNLTIRVEPTAIVLHWAGPYLDNITYIQHTTLYANFTLLDNAPILLSTVNVTFGFTTLELIWNGTAERYQIVFNGTDNPPGFGTSDLTVQAWRYGFQPMSDSTQLIIRKDPTTLSSSWSDGFTIVYVNQTTLIVNYRNSEGVDILGATVNVTIDTETWSMNWDILESAYTLTFNGMDSPYLGSHNLTIRAGKFGFLNIVDTSRYLHIIEEPTYVTYSWLPEYNITYFERTYFFVYYRMSNGSVITDAALNVTIDSTTWILYWNNTQMAYGMWFNGSDTIPGLGTHTLNVSASLYGFEDSIDWSQSLVITLEGTDLTASWSAPNFNSITFLQSTELQVFYEMKNGTPVLNAIVNVTIGTKTWNLTWNGAYYSVLFNGTDIEPGIGSHNLIIKAGKAHFQNRENPNRTLTIDLEPTTISSSVQNVFITYVEDTQLIVTYALLNTTPIEGATVNVTINSGDGTYRIRFNGTDDPPGLDTHNLAISAWKYGHENRTDSETLVISPEPTSILISWSPSDSITYLQNTLMQVDYRMSDYTSIPDANVMLFIGASSWPMTWNAASGFHEITINGTDPIPGLGTHGITVQASKLGFAANANGTETLTIDPEPTAMILTWEATHLNNITFVEYTTLYANYTLVNGTVLSNAIVNVTILGQPWDLHWNPILEVYQIQFNGTDNPPDLGTHILTVFAWKHGYEERINSSQTLFIEEEPASIIITWSDGSSITYLQETTLQVDYRMNNDTSIPFASVIVSIGLDSWPLVWNGTIHKITFNGTDLTPGLGSHDLDITASKYGYENAFNDLQNLNISTEPTNFAVSWEATYANNITYLESTTLFVGYYFSNMSAIPDATVSVTILTLPWPLNWNGVLELYEVTFDGADDPPGFGNHTLAISILRFGYTEQNPKTSLVIRPEPTTVTPNWIYDEFEYDKTLNLIFEYRDSHGTLIAAATQKEVWVNSTAETLLGTTGAYRILLDNRFELGFHTVAVNISKYGYVPAYNDAVSFTILNASTYITVDWSSSSIDYLGQFDLTLFYGLQFPIMFPWVPTGGVTANLTINGIATLPLNLTGEYWTANITGASLGIGAHSMLIEVWSYGYEFQQNLTILTVNLVPTSLDYEWSPANVTIEYTMYLNLTLNYTYYGGDIPDSAEVNVTINARTFALAYVGGTWEVSILGADVNTGVYDATIRASYPFFESKTEVTFGINITPAANTFLVEWTPFDRNISYAESVSIAVVYTHDYSPVLGANVTLTINGTGLQTLVYSPIDEKWHISFDATVLGLGTWNFTIRANKTGYESGAEWYYVLVEEDIPNLTPSWTLAEIDYLSSVILQIDVDSSNGSAIDDAIVELTLLGSTISTDHIGSGIYNTSFGPYIDLGVHSINITFARFGYMTTTIFLTLNVTEADATLTLDYTSLTIYYDEFVNFNASYLMTNMSYIQGASFQLTVNASAHTYVWSGDHWEATFSGAALGLGASMCSVMVDAYGFRSINGSFTIIVQAIPTLMTIGPSGSTYVNGTYTFIVTYEDNRTSTYIDVDIISITWPGTYGTNQLGVGQYEIQLNADLHNGTYSLILNLSKAGHIGASINRNVDVLPIPVEMTYESTMEEYESEYLLITISLNDTIYNRPVHWAYVVLTFDGSDFVMRYNHTTATYTGLILLDDTGDYTLYISAAATDCVVPQGTIALSVLPKEDYTLTLSTSPDEVEAGDILHLTALLTSDGSPVSGMEVFFLLTILDEDGGSQDVVLSDTTNGEGVATAEIEIISGTTSIEINAEFRGSRQAWATASGASTIVVRQPTTTPPGLLAFLSDPLVQLMLIAAVAAVVGVGYSKSRRKPKTPIDSSSILLGIGHLAGVRHCILYNANRRSHILAKSYMATGQDSYIIRALEDIAATGLSGNDIPGFTFELSLHGLQVHIYRGKLMAGVLTAYADEKVKYLENLKLLVDTFEEQYGMELPDWPKNISVYGDIWRIIGPDATDIERVKTLVYSIEEGAIRAEISNRLNMSVKKVSTLIKQLLDADPDFQAIRVGRKKLVVFQSALGDEIS
jgi:hypothetical protein